MALDSYGNYVVANPPLNPNGTPYVSGGAPDYVDYAGPPHVNPPAVQNITVDSLGQQWQWFPDAQNPTGAWH